MRNVPGGVNNRARHAATWQRLAGIKISVPGWGNITVAQMLEQISTTGTDQQSRNALARECENLAAILSPLPAAARDEVIARITDAVREAYERNDAQADNNGVRQ